MKKGNKLHCFNAFLLRLCENADKARLVNDRKQKVHVIHLPEAGQTPGVLPQTPNEKRKQIALF